MATASVTRCLIRLLTQGFAAAESMRQPLREQLELMERADRLGLHSYTYGDPGPLAANDLIENSLLAPTQSGPADVQPSLDQQSDVALHGTGGAAHDQAGHPAAAADLGGAADGGPAPEVLQGLAAAAAEAGTGGADQLHSQPWVLTPEPCAEQTPRNASCRKQDMLDEADILPSSGAGRQQPTCELLRMPRTGLVQQGKAVEAAAAQLACSTWTAPSSQHANHAPEGLVCQSTPAAAMLEAAMHSGLPMHAIPGIDRGGQTGQGTPPRQRQLGALTKGKGDSGRKRSRDSLLASDLQLFCLCSHGLSEPLDISEPSMPGLSGASIQQRVDISSSLFAEMPGEQCCNLVGTAAEDQQNDRSYISAGLPNAGATNGGDVGAAGSGLALQNDSGRNRQPAMNVGGGACNKQPAYDPAGSPEDPNLVLELSQADICMLAGSQECSGPPWVLNKVTCGSLQPKKPEPPPSFQGRPPLPEHRPQCIEDASKPTEGHVSMPGTTDAAVSISAVHNGNSYQAAGNVSAATSAGAMTTMPGCTQEPLAGGTAPASQLNHCLHSNCSCKQELWANGNEDAVRSDANVDAARPTNAAASASGGNEDPRPDSHAGASRLRDGTPSPQVCIRDQLTKGDPDADKGLETGSPEPGSQVYWAARGWTLRRDMTQRVSSSVGASALPGAQPDPLAQQLQQQRHPQHQQQASCWSSAWPQDDWHDQALPWQPLDQQPLLHHHHQQQQQQSAHCSQADELPATQLAECMPSMTCTPSRQPLQADQHPPHSGQESASMLAATAARLASAAHSAGPLASPREHCLS